MGTPTKLISYEDSLTMPENRLEEIVQGESRIMPPDTKWHVNLIEALAGLLKGQLDSRAYRVTSSGAGLGIERSPLTYRIPDLMIFRAEALWQGDANDPYIWTVPELIVECLSPSNRKGLVRELLADYGQIMAQEVWLLDPTNHAFTSYRYTSGEMREWQTLESGIVSPSRLPCVTVDLTACWAAFDHGIRPLA